MIYKRKQLTVEAYQVTENNLELLEEMFNGSIKGTALPCNKRCIDFWSGNREHRAEIGDYITVCKEECIITVYSSEDFHDNFEDTK